MWLRFYFQHVCKKNITYVQFSVVFPCQLPLKIVKHVKLVCLQNLSERKRKFSQEKKKFEEEVEELKSQHEVGVNPSF